jgi:uncharacterized membrane protein YhiD involved in acid resistance
VIFKEGLNVRGLNTAATLWCSAAHLKVSDIDSQRKTNFRAPMLSVLQKAIRPMSRSRRRGNTLPRAHIVAALDRHTVGLPARR